MKPSKKELIKFLEKRIAFYEKKRNFNKSKALKEMLEYIKLNE